jgi:hypothetical protein
LLRMERPDVERVPTTSGWVFRFEVS